MYFNPYIAGNPVTGEGFFGRQNLLKSVLRVLNNQNDTAIVLYGQRRIGKTSILLQLEQQLKQVGEFSPVYFDLQDKADKLLANVVFELAQRIAFSLNIQPPQLSNFQDDYNYFHTDFLPVAINKLIKEEN